LTGFFKGIIPDAAIHSRFSEAGLRQVLDSQADDVFLRGQGRETRMLLILDDVLGEPKSVRCDSMCSLATEGRHLNIVVLAATQYPVALPPIVRTNVDWAFLLGEVFFQNKKRMFENFSGVFRTFSDWDTVFRASTMNHGAMVLRCSRNTSDGVEGNVFHWQAEAQPPPGFTLGSLAFQGFANGENGGETSVQSALTYEKMFIAGFRWRRQQIDADKQLQIRDS
jgi:hypothetical protein